MFTALKKRSADRVVAAEIAELERIAVIPFPTARVPLCLVESQKQRFYEEVAQQLGFIPAELTRAQLLEFFDSESIKLYDYSQVQAWLTGKKEQAKARNWCWRALREKDVIEGYEWGVDHWNAVWHDGFYSKRWECRPYERLVPMHALEKVAKIEAKFGDRVKFFVSDYTSLKVDPFIMVRPAMCDSGREGKGEYNLIFDVWDEPGFGV